MKKTCAVLVFALLGAAPPQEDARETLRRLGVKKGICVVAGAPVDAIGLARAGELVVYVQLEDGGKIEELRRAAETEGLLGKRLYAEKGSLARIHLADNTADAVLAAAGARRDEILRVLRPGGKAFLGAEALAKPFAEGMDEWSHPYHGPDNNPQSKDTLARGPFLTQFMSEPWYSAMPQFSVLSGGRVFKIFGERTSTQAHWESLNSLVALNAWNGTLLWRRKLPETFMFHRNTFVATPEALYLADDKSCKVFDPDTGEVRDEIIAPAELSDGPVWKWMALEGGVLYALVGEAEPGVEVVKGNRFRGAGWPWWKVNDYRFGFGRTLLAIDPKSKKILWHHRDDLPLDARAMCMASGKIFVYSDQKFLAALDAKTGKSLWKNSDEKLLAAIGKHDPAQVPQQGFASTSFAKCSDKAIYFAGPTRTRVVAASTEDGRLLWDRQGGNYQLVIRPEALYALGGGPTRSFKLDLMTGEVLAQFGARVACTRATANADAIFVRGGRGGSTTVYDVQSAEVQTDLISPMRPACQDGVVVANGRLYWGPWICRCDTTQIGVISLGPAGDFDRAAGAAEDRLEKGTGASTVAAIEVTDKDWPAYRHDNARSGRSPLPVPAGVVEKWTFAPSGANVATAPIASGGWVFLAGSDGAIRALDAADGKLRWTAHTGGWVKFAPTLAEGRLYAGSGDGWVYCLEAASGRLLWRFRAAPAERKIPVYGSLFSTWPVGSGVLVHDGVAYAAAGMANYDGSHVYALDAATGKIRWQNNQSGHLPAARPESGAGVQGNLLLHDGALYLPGGNLVPVAKYEIADGKFSRYGMPDRANVLGKDLYVIDGQVRSTGYPLYWRQQDSHHITFARFPAADGHLAVNEGTIGLADPKPGAQGKPQWKWSRQEFTEVAGVAFAQNAVVAAGVNWTGEGPDAKASGGIAALDPKDGRVLWKHALPGVPVMFGAAIDREGRILVSLQDGRVVCLAAR